MAKDALYFSHDSNASNDPKMIAMRAVYGTEGYGRYWLLIEMMREADGYRLDMRSKYALHAYADHLKCDCNAFASFLHDCIHEFNLFNSDEDYFWSESLLRRMKIKDEKSEKARQSAEARWNKQQIHANASKTDASATKIDAYKERKVKINKDNKIHYADNVTLTEKEYTGLCEKFGKDVADQSIRYLSSYKLEKDYKTKNDNLTIQRWVVDAVKKTATLATGTEKKGPRLELVTVTPEESERLAIARQRQMERNQQRNAAPH